MSYTKHELYNRARYSFYDQKKRCENDKNPLFKWYGLKGIAVEYNLKDFLKWYYENAKGFEKPTVDRIDHNKNYCFENVQIVEKSENSKERIRRLGTPIPRRKVILIKNNEEIGVFPSVHAVADHINGQQGNVQHCLKGRRLTHKGYSFKYLE
jgi:hypothetical protein